MLSGAVAIIIGGLVLMGADERQVTFTPKNHNLDNNDNFSRDGRFLCYDTRETVGPGIENCQSIEMVEIATGAETVLYRPEASVTGAEAAPGVGAVSFSPVADEAIFIHGPLVEDVQERGYYAKPNRTGAIVPADGSGTVTWADRRDVETGRPTLPGAHRGGTHRHEYSLDGQRIGFTYDDFLLPQYGRTIGYMERHASAPAGATHYFALLVSVVPEAEAKPGDLVYAAGDSWIGREGLMRGFIGRTKNGDQSLYVVDVPRDVDITTARAGDAEVFPAPPEGLTVRRLTHSYAEGIVRGTVEGDRIAYYGKDASDRMQVFIIPSNGSDRASDPALRPVQATFFEDGAGPGVRWHSSGNSIACTSGGGVAVTCVEPGPRFGETVFLTPQGDGVERINLVWSPDGSMLAYNRAVATEDESGVVVKAYDGSDLLQIFVVGFPDGDGDGVVDGVE